MRCQPYIAYLNDHHADLITQVTGCAPTCDHGPKILWWKNEQPDDYARVAKFLMPSAYVAGKMAGLSADQAFMDYTFIHFTGLADNQAGEWSTEICDVLDVDQAKLPANRRAVASDWRGDRSGRARLRSGAGHADCRRLRRYGGQCTRCGRGAAGDDLRRGRERPPSLLGVRIRLWPTSSIARC